MQNTNSYKPMRRDWSAVELLANIKSEHIIAKPSFISQYKEFLLCDLKAESDAKNLYNELTMNHQYSQEFHDFLEIWYKDELNHAAGFRKILHILYGEDEQKLADKMQERVADFSCLKEFFLDEFKLCVLFAYDEYASTMTYKKDKFYAEFGPKEFVRWIKTVTSDEARHFVNAVKLIHHSHQHRLSETREVLDKILAYENGVHVYQSTFLFDHDTEHFQLDSEELNGECADWVYKKIMMLS